MALDVLTCVCTVELMKKKKKNSSSRALALICRDERRSNCCKGKCCKSSSRGLTKLFHTSIPFLIALCLRTFSLISYSFDNNAYLIFSECKLPASHGCLKTSWARLQLLRPDFWLKPKQGEDSLWALPIKRQTTTDPDHWPTSIST